jgi:hypothetical protein
LTGKADFSSEEWETVLEGPTSAGMVVMTAERGGTFRETFAMAKAYAEARKEHGESALLDEIVSTKPEMDHTRVHSPEEMREHGLQRIRDAVALVEAKASAAELGDYRLFVTSLAKRVAAAKTEKGDQPVSDAESAAIDAIGEALGA